MLLKMNFLLLKNFPCQRKFVFVKSNTYYVLLLAINFLKVFPAGTAPGYIDIVYVGFCINEY